MSDQRMRLDKIQDPNRSMVFKIIVIETVVNKIFFKARLPHLLSAHNPSASQDCQVPI